MVKQAKKIDWKNTLLLIKFGETETFNYTDSKTVGLIRTTASRLRGYSTKITNKGIEVTRK